jgi:hypothetical protein
MKKHIFLFLVLFSLKAVAQVRYSMYAGVVYNAVSGTGRVVYFEGPPSYAGSTNLTVGTSLSIPLYKKLQYEAGLSYCGKGDSYVLPVFPDYGGTSSRKLHYIVLSQDAIVQLPVTKQFRLGTGLGLWGAVAAAGRFNQQRLTFGGPRNKSGSISFSDDSPEPGFKRIDAGATILLRAQYGQIQLTGRYQPSFADYNAKEKIRFTTVSVTAGYLF